METVNSAQSPENPSKTVPFGEGERSRVVAPEIVADQGTGRANTVLIERQSAYTTLAPAVAKALTQGRTVTVALPTISDQGWQQISIATGTLLEQSKVRQATLIGMGAASTIALHRALVAPKSVRALVLVNPTTRAHPSDLLTLLDRLEAALPLGLPFRLESKGFDARPFLHRIRCPLIVITTASASQYEIKMAEEIRERAPTAWHRALGQTSSGSEIAAVIAEIQRVPVKCPQ